MAAPPTPTKPPPPRKAAPSVSQPAAAPASVEPAPIEMPEKKFVPPIMVVNAVEGWGKTTLGAFAPGAQFIMAAGEPGYLTLYGNGRVPAVPYMTVHSWPQLLASIDHISVVDSAKVKVLVLDAIGGLERMCHEHVCQKEFGGDWGEKGFLSYHKGYDVSINYWLSMLVRLQSLRDNRGVAIVLLSHAKISNFKNPMGEDFDRYVADCHPKTWGVTAKLADVVLFGNFFTVTEEATTNKKRHKGVGGNDRVVYTERSDAYDAKNRHGMEPVISLTDKPEESWGIVWQAMTGGKG